jgi:ABC-type multidrug transport system fused ATPase/permease subunit
MLAVLPLAAIGAFESVPPVTMAALRAREVAAAGRRLLDLQALPAPVADPPDPEPVPDGCPPVVFEEARLRYADDLPWALNGLTLSLAPGERLAVVGSSGAGKTSLVNVLLRFWPLQAGTARLGGIDLARLAQADVRRAVALVEQDARLFAGSIADNVTLARPDATDHEIALAVRRAQLEEWVDTLPEGLGTPVGEHGGRVSGGQRQRIALARALLAGAPVLVLDEPTAGLDEPTAARLLHDVLAAGAGHSVLLVTHREHEAALFDHVVVVEEGRVVGPG